MSELIVSFSRSAAEAAALTGTANYEILANLLDAGALKSKELGFFKTLLIITMIRRENLIYLNVDRSLTNLRSDPNYFNQDPRAGRSGVVSDTVSVMLLLHTYYYTPVMNFHM